MSGCPRESKNSHKTLFNEPIGGEQHKKTRIKNKKSIVLYLFANGEEQSVTDIS